MDETHFDRLTKGFSSRRSRRGTLGGLLAGLLLPMTATARDGKSHRKQTSKDRDRVHSKGKNKNKDKERASTQATDCWRAGACILKKGANVSRCDLAGYTSSATLDCTGCNISRANLRGANLSRANLTRANLSGSCLIDANLAGATIANNTNLANALFCNTTMPDGSTNNSGCGSGTECCPTCTEIGGGCLRDGDCCGGAGCYTGRCCIPATCQSLGKQCGTWQSGCGTTISCGNCTGPGQVCVDGQCACTPTTCAALGKQCGSWPDGCGETLQCGNCGTGATPACNNGVCASCTATCGSSCFCANLADGSTRCWSRASTPCNTCSVDSPPCSEGRVCVSTATSGANNTSFSAPQFYCQSTAPGICMLLTSCGPG